VAGVTWLWYSTRASGTVALVLLTLAIVLGVAQVSRVRSEMLPRFVLDGLHRHIALLAGVFLTIHVLTAILDTFAPINLFDVFIPFVGAYRPLWLGLGATALDLLIAVGITSAFRERLGHHSWRIVHWFGYAVWPVAFVHALGTGSDIRQGWMGFIAVVCAAAVLAAGLIRIGIGWPENRGRRLAAAGAALTYVVVIMVWVPSGPLGRNWAARAGTPQRLLPHASTATSTRPGS
jgi:sulfoxide reductase heme-binding subunit YedZ